MVENPVDEPAADAISQDERQAERRAERWAHGIYGTIIVTALLVTLQEHDQTADEVIAAVLGTAFVLFLAHSYSTALARQVTTRHRPLHGEVFAILVDNLPLLLAVVIPSFFIVLAAGGVVSLDAAFWIGIGYGLASLFAMGFIYGRTTDHRLPGSLVLGLTSAGLGAAIILLETAVE